MIIVDTERSGSIDFEKNGVWQIGAVEFENPSNTFFQEARIDDEDIINKESLRVTGKTEVDLRDKNKQSQKELISNFLKWSSKIENKIFVAQNTPYDFGFIVAKAKKYNLKIPFHHRTLDLHSVAVMKFLEIKGKLPFEKGESVLGLSRILEFCGIEDNRINLENGNNGTPHNGLQDAKLEAECLSRILNGRALFKEFEKFRVPEYLKPLR